MLKLLEIPSGRVYFDKIFRGGLAVSLALRNVPPDHPAFHSTLANLPPPTKIHPYRSVIAQISPLGVSPFPLARDVSITAAKTRKVGNNAFLMGESKFFLMNHLNFLLLNPLKLSVCRKERLDISIQGFDFAEFVFFHFYSLLCISHFYTRIYTTRWLVTSLTSKII